MCWYGGVMTLEEYRKEISDIQKLMLKRFKEDEDDAVYEIKLQFRDDWDRSVYGQCSCVFKRFSSVEAFVHKQKMTLFDEEPMEERAYWSVIKYKLFSEFVPQVECNFSVDMKLLSVRFLLKENLTKEETDHSYLLTGPKNVQVPYQTGDILKIHAMPFDKDLYVVYGGERGEGLWGGHWCIYVSEDRIGLWIDDLSDRRFSDFMLLPHSPLMCSEPAVDCPDIGLLNMSQKLKADPQLWFRLAEWCETFWQEGYAKIEDSAIYKLG